MTSDRLSNKHRLSIGLPVYNGEKFLQSRLDGILSQTFSDFDLVISDNASTDSTADICKEYALKDNRISYIRQEKNIGPFNNFKFILDKAHNEYFVFAAVDDLWKPTFLEKNIKVLDSDDDVVGSISKCTRYGTYIEDFSIFPEDSFFIQFYKKIRGYFRKYGSVSATGSYDKRIRSFLKNLSGQNIYAIFRTNHFKNVFPIEHNIAFDPITILKILKFGEIHLVDEELLCFYSGGFSSEGMKNLLSDIKIGKFGIFFPTTTFTLWCLKNLGYKIFLKNLDIFLISMTITNLHMTLSELWRLIKNK
jgi:glycosyltransferase involved in cell wall biosynthesis